MKHFLPALAVALTVSTAFAQQEPSSRVSDQQSDSQDMDSQSIDLFRDSRVIVGFRIAPVHLNLHGKNRALVGLGSYLVNAVAGCNDCHTHPSFAPGGNPFLGQPEVINSAQYLSGGRMFGPFIVSKNITPDEFGLPAGLRFEQFESALRTGRDPENPNHILQVMPWDVFSKMTPLDLRAIYEFLRAIPSLPNNPNPGP